LPSLYSFGDQAFFFLLRSYASFPIFPRFFPNVRGVGTRFSLLFFSSSSCVVVLSRSFSEVGPGILPSSPGPFADMTPFQLENLVCGLPQTRNLLSPVPREILKRPSAGFRKFLVPYFVLLGWCFSRGSQNIFPSSPYHSQ